MRPSRLLVAAVSLSAPASALSQEGTFRPDDWITFADFRYVTSVAVASDVAYFGTTSGVERYDTLRDLWLPPVTAADGLPDGRVEALAIEPSGSVLWIGTARGLARFDAAAGEVEPAHGLPPTRVGELRIDPGDGTVYAFVAGGWWVGRGGSPVLERSDPPPPAARGSVPVDAIDPLDLPWSDPLYVRSDTAAHDLFRLTAVDRDVRGDWYVGTWGDNGRRWGAGRASWEELRFGLGGPGGGPIVRTSGGFWFVPAEGGEAAARARVAAAGGPAGRDVVRARVSAGGAAPTALAFAGDDGTWRYQAAVETVGLPAVSATAGVAVGDTLYLGTAQGLVRLVPGDPALPEGIEAGPGGEAFAGATSWGPGEGLSPPITAVVADGRYLWLGTRDGLVLWDRALGTPAERYLQGRSIPAIAPADDAVFVATDGGLQAATRPAGSTGAPAGEFTRVRTVAGAPHALALRGTLLLVATAAGLEVFDRRSGTWRVTTAGGGRLPAVPLSFAVDDEQVWIGTSEGFTRWRPATDEWESYGPADGLAGAPVLHLLVEEDAVWASTPKGVSRFGWRNAAP